MKHLKKFNEKMYTFGIDRDAVKDILNSLEDDGFLYQDVFRNYGIGIDISGKSTFKWGDISDTISHLTAYLEEYEFIPVSVQYFSYREHELEYNIVKHKDMSDDTEIVCGVSDYCLPYIDMDEEDTVIDVRISYGTKYEKRSLNPTHMGSIE